MYMHIMIIMIVINNGDNNLNANIANGSLNIDSLIILIVF